MSFNYFNTTKTGYSGQNLHIVRNGQEFNLKELLSIPAGTNVTYQFLNPFSSSVTAYNDVEVNVNGSAAIIKASPTTNKMLTSFKVKITIQSEEVSILILVHEAISKVWLSPSILTIRKNYDKIRFGVFAKFDDNILSWLLLKLTKCVL